MKKINRQFELTLNKQVIVIFIEKKIKKKIKLIPMREKTRIKIFKKSEALKIIRINSLDLR